MAVKPQAVKSEAAKPEAADPEAATPVAGKRFKALFRNKKLLLIAGVAVIVLALGGGAGWYYLNLSKKDALSEGEEEVVLEPVQKVPHGPPTFLPLDNMVVNLADPGGEKVAQVGVTLELLDAKATEKVKAYLPAIRSGILLLLSQRTSEELLQREGKEKLAADILTEASRHFVGSAEQGKSEEDENPVRGVLFSSFIIQ